MNISSEYTVVVTLSVVVEPVLDSSGRQARAHGDGSGECKESEEEVSTLVFGEVGCPFYWFIERSLYGLRHR